MLPEAVQQKLASLPAAPGCYLFRGADGATLYVGKAKSLRQRVRSYFQEGSTDTRAFIPLLLRHLVDLDTRVTATEKEAAILENALIKELLPRFNVKLRDDKEFLSLRLPSDHPYPRLTLVRRPADDGARYFGPYPSATAARRTLNLVEKHFQLRTCTDRELGNRSRPCLQHQIGRCLAPCVLPVDRERYAAQVRAVGLFIEGRQVELERELTLRMQAASAEEDYERAAAYRDQLRAVALVHQGQRVEHVGEVHLDALGLHREGDRLETSRVTVRDGRVVDIATASHSRVELPDDEIVAALVRELYADEASGRRVPEVLLVPVLPEGAEGVAEWLTERRRAQVAAEGGVTPRGKVQLLAPARGPRRRLIELARENALHAFNEKQRSADDVTARLGRLQEKLRLPTLPRRIECLDISHLGGGDTVGALVLFVDGRPAKRGYRTYKLRGVSGGDDYAALHEVLDRRFRRGLEAAAGGEAEHPLPDLLVVDGGRGQLAVALAAAHDLGLFDLPLAGLAKERETAAGEALVDRVYLPGQKNPVGLRTGGPELLLLAAARDEAHRFANRGRERLGQARRLRSGFEDVKGLGPGARRALSAAFGSVQAALAAPRDAWLAVAGVTARHADALERFRDGPTPGPSPARGADDPERPASPAPPSAPDLAADPPPDRGA